MAYAEKFAFRKIFSSGMVLQRERNVRLSGTAEPRKTVRLKLLGNTHEAETDEEGIWTAEFPPLPSGGPYSLALSGAEGVPPVVLDNILSGEVWLCAGQSNMEMPLKSDTSFSAVFDAEKEISTAANRNIRLYNAQLKRRLSADAPCKDSLGPEWVECSPESVRLFSAAGYFFGKKIERDLACPVGLVNIAWGGTSIESWIFRGKFERENAPELEVFHPDRKFPSSDLCESEMDEELREWISVFEAQGEATKKDLELWKREDFDDSSWPTVSMPVSMSVPGVTVLRCIIEADEKLCAEKLTFHLGSMNDTDQVFLNGKLIGTTGIDTRGYWAAKRVYEAPAGLLHPGKNTLLLRCSDHIDCGGFTPPETDGCYFIVSSRPSEKRRLALWKRKDEFISDRLKIGTRPPVPTVYAPDGDSVNFPTNIFNGMVAPWTNFNFRGILWYQGCNNAGQVHYYRLMKHLIEDWREQWHDVALPFIVTQLAGFETNSGGTPLPEDFWRTAKQFSRPYFAVTREIQALMPKVYKNVGLAVTIDLGEQSDIHPRNKKDVGLRLAAEAERLVYGRETGAPGPEVLSIERKGPSFTIRFGNVGKGLKTSDGNPPGAFFVSDSSGKLHKANASISRDTVTVSSQDVSEPTSVRYAFCSFRGDVNLVNSEGFPAIPFRSNRPDYEKLCSK